MKITFVIHGLSVSGGVRVVFEYANHLTEKGHQVTLVVPIGPIRDVSSSVTLKEWFLDRVRIIINNHIVCWFPVNATIKFVPSLSEKY
ncbi:MAG: hypothetical protein Q8K40_04365, partial [Ignavibacteria bacterium]|nr:hypothetical protein [Ignavibacteria bacterium]